VRSVNCISLSTLRIFLRTLYCSKRGAVVLRSVQFGRYEYITLSEYHILTPESGEFSRLNDFFANPDIFPPAIF